MHKIGKEETWCILPRHHNIKEYFTPILLRDSFWGASFIYFNHDKQYLSLFGFRFWPNSVPGVFTNGDFKNSFSYIFLKPPFLFDTFGVWRHLWTQWAPIPVRILPDPGLFSESGTSMESLTPRVWKIKKGFKNFRKYSFNKFLKSFLVRGTASRIRLLSKTGSETLPGAKCWYQ